MDQPIVLDTKDILDSDEKLNARHYIKFTIIFLLALLASLAIVLMVIYMPKYIPTPPIPPEPVDPGESAIPNAYNINLSSRYYNKGLIASINLINYRPKSTKIKEEEIKVLTFEGTSLDDHMLRITVNDSSKSRWEVSGFPKGEMYDEWIEGFQHYNLAKQGWDMQQVDNHTFYMQLMLLGKTVIDTYNRSLKYYNNFIEFEFTVPTKRIFGFGERQSSSLILSDGIYTVFNRAQHPIDDSAKPGKNMYGSHPMIMAQTENGRYVIFYMKNSNAMDIVINSSYIPNAKNTSITFKMAGGIIDLLIFHDANAEYLLKKYHSYIGLPTLPPFYALGFQYGERNVGGLDKLKAKLTLLNNANIPYDVIWTDRDFADSYKAFTVNANFNGINQFLQTVPDKKFATVIDAPVVKEDNYFLYENSKQFLIQSNSTNSPFIGKANGKPVVYVNVFSNSAQQLYTNAINLLTTTATVSGWALDMNELYNDCNGECTNPSDSIYNHLIYTPGQVNLSTNALSMDAFYGDKSQVEFNYHNLYSPTLASIFYSALTSTNKRPFIISRSTFPSSGKYGGHWTGDNPASWENLQGSLKSIVNFNLFGIPFTGENICGIKGQTSAELCARWVQLGAFYPLSRVIAEGDLSKLTWDPSVTTAFTTSLKTRYSLLRFMYSKLAQSTMWGGPLITPAAFEFNNDARLFEKEVIDNSFMIGHSILSIFSLKQGLMNGKFYFPNWRWYDLDKLTIAIDFDPLPNANGSEMTLDYSYSKSNAFIKGGSIIPFQSVDLAIVKSTADLAKLPITYYIAVDPYGKAEGQMRVDDGITLNGDYRHYSFTFTNKLFKINRISGFSYKDVQQIDIFRSLKVLGQPIDHELSFACIFDINLNVRNLKYEYDPDLDIITLTDTSAEKDLYALYNIESIIFGGASDQDVCKSRIYMGANSYSADKKQFHAKLAEKIPGQSMLHTFSFDATLKSDKLINIKIEKDSAFDAFEVPYALNESYVNQSSVTLDQYIFATNTTVGAPFYFKVNDRNDPTSSVYSTYDNPFYYSDNFLYLKAKIKGVRIFGIGERVKLFEINDGIYTIMSRDAVSPIETDDIPGNNMYGHHPVYFVQSDNPSEWFAVLMLNPSPLDIRISRKLNVINVEHIMSAGLMDVYIMQKGSIDEIIHEYHMLIGRPVIVPYWVFGNHQCRWGYKGQVVLETVVKNFMTNQIPLDVMWTDIDYMKDYQDFSLNTDMYPTMKEFVNYLQSNHKKLIPINDAGISRTKGYFAYDNGKELGVFIRSGLNHSNDLQGIVWPGYAVYTDFYHPKALDFWKDNMKRAQENFHFDGMWIDMNEASNFCDGECPEEYDYLATTFPNSQHNTIIYIPGHHFLNQKTMSMEGYHDNGELEILLHSSYGHMMGIATSKYFSEVENKRPFVLSRSTYVGSGKYMSHWLGDNFKDYRFLRYSISGIYDAQLFGLTMVGSDICGFTGRAKNFDLCKRWIQIGAFYPFCRNHNDISGAPQEPYVDEDLKSVYVRALHVRYSLIRYFYSLYMNVAAYGGVYFRPLIFDYPKDANTYKNYEDTFMVGNLKISPIMDEDKNEASVYFPNDDWYEFFNGLYQYPYSPSSSVGKYNTVKSDINSGDINLHMRGGSIIPVQQADNNVLTTFDLRDVQTDIKITVSSSGKSSLGNIYYDDGESLDSLVSTNKHCNVSLTYTPSNMVLSISKEGKYDTTEAEMEVGTIKFLHTGALKAVKCGRVYDATGKDTNKLYKATSVSDNVLSVDVHEKIFHFGSIKLNDRCQ